MKIFVCEHDPYRAKLMHDILSVYNYKIVTMQKRGDIFKEIQQQRPAVIVINETFAKESGAEMIAHLRQDPKTAQIPVVFISNSAPVEQQLSQYRFDMLTEIIQEPIKIKNLRHYIDRWTTFRSLYIKH